MLATIEQGLADMKRSRASDDEQWTRIERLGERSRALNVETQTILARRREGR